MKEILDEFGQKIVRDCFDPSIGNLVSLRNKKDPPPMFKQYTELFKKLDEQDFSILKQYIEYNSSNMIFNFLKIFEENEQFKLIFQEATNQINLVEISEMLKAEHMEEGGWIDRFSNKKDI